MKCIYCLSDIDDDRLFFLRTTKRQLTCTECSRENKQEGLMDYAHKTAPQLVLLPNDKEQKRIAQRAFRRAR